MKAPSPMARPLHASRRSGRAAYLVALAWTFTFFNTVRLLTYLPTIWAVHERGASDQHSLLTWLAWAGANVTMGLWLFEQSDRRLERAAFMNFGNALMCLATVIVIVAYR